ncbi:MAG: T9SS type A sorting domain-containing protein [Ignavibacteria bacterium]|nr:T9SS type A sorting domain-containing protein [Ignavibacteria bacterium]
MKLNSFSLTVFALLIAVNASNSVFAGDIKEEAEGALLTAVTLTNDEMLTSPILAIASNSLLSFTIPQSEYVRLSIFNSSGREIAVLIKDYKNAGSFSAELKHAKLTKGTYYYRLVIGRYKEVRRLEITK